MDSHPHANEPVPKVHHVKTPIDIDANGLPCFRLRIDLVLLAQLRRDCAQLGLQPCNLAEPLVVSVLLQHALRDHQEGASQRRCSDYS